MSSDPTMLRLRGANPVAAAPHRDDPELFARITGAAVDERLARPRRRHSRALVLALAICLTAVLASTAYAVSHWINGDVVRPPVTKREYLAAQRQLTLPPGYSWPAFRFGPDSADSVTSRGAGGGLAVLTAQNAWECYWVNAVRAHDAEAGRRAQRALDGLLAHNILEAPAGAPEGWVPTPLPPHPFVAYAHDGGLDWIRASYRQAAAGNIRNIARSCRANSPR